MTQEKVLEYQDYIIHWVSRFQGKGINVTFSQLSSYLLSYFSPTTVEKDLRPEIDDFFERLLEENDQKEKKRMEEIELPYHGITLNEQDIDLLMIANAKSFDELQSAISSITGCSLIIPEDVSLEDAIASIFQSYLDQKISKDDFFQNPSLKLDKKIEYLLSSNQLSSNELKILKDVISSPDIPSKLNEFFSDEQLTKIYQILRDCSPIEKSGIKSSTVEQYRRLYDIIQNKYDSITLDEEGKYGRIVLGNGECDFRHLEKCLQYAESLGKTVRVNTLLFYMDCPEYLYQLDKNFENHDVVKKELSHYVDETTKVLAKYPDTVRSVDVFNELLNRFPISGDIAYQYRGDIPQDSQIGDFDNIKSGWLKHLSIDDLCDVITQARQNLPNTDFMYNDDHLIDPKKMAATKAIISQIQAYEETHQEELGGKRLIDSIGTQMHIDYSCTREQMEQMIRHLSSFGFPIEITEFDLAMTGLDPNLSSTEIEKLRQNKMYEVYDVVSSLKDECNIRGFTIWSKTDQQNFRVSIENEKRIQNKMSPITTLHGGYYSNDMISKDRDINYHTHTNLCGHASTFTEDDYIIQARKNGFTRLGFSDHVPSNSMELPSLTTRMRWDEASSYIKHIRELQNKYPDMKLYCGFEAENVPMTRDSLIQLRDQVDYMILGQHYVDTGFHKLSFYDPDYPLQYGKMVCDGMDTGIFDIVAHPDVFFKSLDKVPKENYDEYMKNSEIALRMICEKAKELDIPVEVNFGALSDQKVKDGKILYPSSMFLSIAEKTQCPVMYGIDAHHPGQFDTYHAFRSMISSNYHLYEVPNTYDIVEVRKQNKKLQERYRDTKNKIYSDEAEMVSMFTNKILSSLPEDISIDDMIFALQQKFSNMEDPETIATEHMKQQISKVNNHSRFSESDKEFVKSRIHSSLPSTIMSVMKKNQLKKNAISFSSHLGEYHCQNKQDVVRVMKLMTESYYQKDSIKKANAQNSLISFQKTNETKKVSPEKGFSYVKKSNGNASTNKSGNHGFYSIQMGIVLLIVTTFVGLILFFVLR